MLCQSESNLLPGPCQSEGRWVGPDGKIRCSMHQIQEFGHAEPLVRVEGYQAPKIPTVNGPRRRAARKTEEVTDTSKKKEARK
jgi:hypothetical protein